MLDTLSSWSPVLSVKDQTGIIFGLWVSRFFAAIQLHNTAQRQATDNVKMNEGSYVPIKLYLRTQI